MGPHWYQMLDEMCEQDHNPDDFDGREWDDLTDDEKSRLVQDKIADLADGIE